MLTGGTAMPAFEHASSNCRIRLWRVLRYLLITDGRSSTISAVYTAIDAIPGSSAVAADRVRPVASDLLLSASLTSKDYLATRLAPLINPANMGGGRGSSHAISVNQGA